MTDTEFAEKAIAGNDDAFLSLMFTHKDVLYRTALAYLKNDDDAVQSHPSDLLAGLLREAIIKRLSGVGRTFHLLSADYIVTSLLYPTTIAPY